MVDSEIPKESLLDVSPRAKRQVEEQHHNALLGWAKEVKRKAESTFVARYTEIVGDELGEVGLTDAIHPMALLDRPLKGALSPVMGFAPATRGAA